MSCFDTANTSRRLRSGRRTANVNQFAAGLWNATPTVHLPGGRVLRLTSIEAKELDVGVAAVKARRARSLMLSLGDVDDTLRNVQYWLQRHNLSLPEVRELVNHLVATNWRLTP
jgi:hypothetical protein